MSNGSEGSRFAQMLAALGGFLGGVAALITALVALLAHNNPTSPAGVTIGAVKDIVFGDLQGATRKLAAVAPPDLPPEPLHERGATPRPAPAIQTDTTNGVTVGVTSAALTGNRLTVAFFIQNNTARRFHFLDAQYEPGQNLQIDGGRTLGAPVVSMAVCRSDVSHCLSNPNSLLPQNFDYADPGKIKSGSFS